MVVYAHDEVANVQDYMIANILACLCCCWCIGIAGIIKSNECQVRARERVSLRIRSVRVWRRRVGPGCEREGFPGGVGRNDLT